MAPPLAARGSVMPDSRRAIDGPRRGGPAGSARAFFCVRPPRKDIAAGGSRVGVIYITPGPARFGRTVARLQPAEAADATGQSRNAPPPPRLPGFAALGAAGPTSPPPAQPPLTAHAQGDSAARTYVRRKVGEPECADCALLSGILSHRPLQVISKNVCIFALVAWS